MPPAPVTVIIPTFNEEANIAAAIRSVRGWARQVFVVDSFSTDKTVDIALQVGDESVGVVQHAFENYSAQWNWAITRLPITQDWVMKLDADECATPEFRDEVAQRLNRGETEVNGYIVHWKLIFMGQWLKWGGLYPNGNLRIWRHGKGRFENRDVNEHVVVEGGAQSIRAPLEHRDFKSLTHWLDRHNRYASMEAKALISENMCGGLQPRLFGQPDERRVWMRRLYHRLPCRPFIYFLYRYLVRCGFLDGWMGFRFAFLHAAFLYWIDLKQYEYRSSGHLPEVAWPARGKPHPAIATSKLQQFVDSAIDQPDPYAQQGHAA